LPETKCRSVVAVVVGDDGDVLATEACHGCIVPEHSSAV
jgi:hypothetical protein